MKRFFKVLTLCILTFAIIFSISTMAICSAIHMNIKDWLASLPTAYTLYTSTATYMDKTHIVFTNSKITDSATGLAVNNMITYSSGTSTGALPVTQWGKCASAPAATHIGDSYITTAGVVYYSTAANSTSWQKPSAQ